MRMTIYRASHRRCKPMPVEGRSRDPFAVLGRHGIYLGRHHPRDATRRLRRHRRSRATSPALRTELRPMRHTRPLRWPEPGGQDRDLLAIDWGGPIQETEDPYAFGPLLGELDVYLLGEGKHRDLAQCLGAHAVTVDGVPGVRFAVWAPSATRVSVVGNFNSWDGRRHPMRLRHGAGVWEDFCAAGGAGPRFTNTSCSARTVRCCRTRPTRSPGGPSRRRRRRRSSMIRAPFPLVGRNMVRRAVQAASARCAAVHL